ncbi:MAG: hydrogenase accessory protein HypB [Aquabacterium sp.]|uniref:hydrogenase nickel incorporation protein HypB n=1 Tax=Aquabacterium sp. TaxID=1872578 RepID=UPI001216BFF3|nr:hydrogenase nickel incorporation protein HypB [Aquabacterium sp.]TAK98691.1 MAG: hydrogenase accessory protein HypB [Aquabacterium sp.]
MCTICGCESAQHHAPPPGDAPAHQHGHPDMHTRVLQLEQDILAGNNHVAAHIREHLAAHHTLALNLVSSPGSGKTSLLVETVSRLKGRRPVAVIEGDQQTSFDAERIRATGVQAVQINTGKGCHLDARMVHDALHDLPPLDQGVLMIENVGNLVCPAAFDLGEKAKVLVFSVTEGEDKPLKYPDMFQAAGLILLNKCDLLPHLRFDMDKALAFIRQVNPGASVIRLSATTGQGFDDWMGWLEQQCTAA